MGASDAGDQQCAAVGIQSPAKIMDIAFLASFKAAYFETSHNPLTASRKYVAVLYWKYFLERTANSPFQLFTEVLQFCQLEG